MELPPIEKSKTENIKKLKAFKKIRVDDCDDL